MHNATQQGVQGAKNIGEMERVISTVSGAALVLSGITHLSPYGVLRTIVGGGLLYRGITGTCSLYNALGINTAKKETPKGIKIEKVIQIRVPRSELFQFWKKLENLPRVMTHLKSVEKIDNIHSKWTAVSSAGHSVSWDAKIINLVEDELIAWQSMKGAELPNVGSVRFEEGHPGETTLKLSMQFYPPGGSIGVAIARILGDNPEQQITEDLQRFKTEMETRQHPAYALAHG